MAPRPRLTAVVVTGAAIATALGYAACSPRSSLVHESPPPVAVSSPGPVAQLDEARFDHGVTGWPLRGQHATTACATCHTTTDPRGVRMYTGVNPSCAGCHPGSHAGQVFASRDCSACHSPQTASLTAVDFDHSRFPLGAHRKHACVECHTPELGATLPGPACVSCHAEDSPHDGRFAAFGSPPACETCHASGSWRATRFAHDRLTRFALTSEHAGLECGACHRGRPDGFERLKPGLPCKGCHAHACVHADDEHPRGRYTSRQCGLCHRASMERRIDRTLIDAHGVGSRFPLVLHHGTVRCAECHPSGIAPVTDAGSPACDRCHVDAHAGARGADCVRCHTPGTWVVAQGAQPP